MSRIAELLPIAVAAAERASAIIGTRVPETLTAKGDRDYASDVDFSIERDIRKFLAAETPTIAFLGEEEGLSGSASALRWTLDPIDGTVNFANSIPLCAVSLALIDGDVPVLGVIQLPLLGNRLYTAVTGQGSYRDGQPIRVARPDSLRSSVVSIGDYAVGENAAERNTKRLALTALLAKYALRIRMFGSAAIDLVWLADGSTGATIMLSNNPWDTAGGVIIAREAGALVTDLDGQPHRTDSGATIAVSPTIADEIAQLLRSL